MIESLKMKTQTFFGIKLNAGSTMQQKWKRDQKWSVSGLVIIKHRGSKNAAHPREVGKQAT